MLGGKSDVAVDTERFRDLVAEIRAETLARDAAHHFADQPSVGEGVVAVVRARLPPWLLRGECGSHCVPVKNVIRLEWLANRGEAGAMAQQIIYRNFFLARLCKLGPVLRHRGVQIELALIDQAMRAHRSQPLGGRIDIYDGVALPSPGPRFIGVAAPQIDDRPAVERDRES